MVITCPVADKPKSAILCNAFMEGTPKSAKAFVFYGVNQSNMSEFRLARESGRDWYYIDNSYFDCVRGRQFRITKNRFQVNVLARAGRTTGERFRALGIMCAPLRPAASNKLLVVEQSPSFMSDIAGYPAYLEDLLKCRAPHTQVRVRPWSPNKPKLARSLQEDLVWADELITHSSAAAVEALIVGLQVNVSAMSALFATYQGDRLSTLGVLADNQFSISEMKDGTAWRTLNP